MGIWRDFHPSRSEWAFAVRVTGHYTDPPGPEAVDEAIDDVLDDDEDGDEDGDEGLGQLTYTSYWNHDRRTFRVDVFAHEQLVLDAALRALAEDDLLAPCGLRFRLRWSDGP